MKRLRTANPSASFVTRLSPLIAISVAAALLLLLLAGEVTARVGGGQSYGGGGGHGGDGGGDGGAIIGVVRLLLYLTIEYPAVGVPLDIVFVVYVVYRFTKRGQNKSEAFTSETITAFPLGLESPPGRPEGFARSFEQLRKFDPNFSEIVFSDFCYALYAKAQDARGHGASTLDSFSPYLSESTRKLLLQRNPSGLQEVKGVIIGGMKIVRVSGLDTPVVNISLAFEANYTEVLGGAGRPSTEMTY